jgi:hypothetical protein
MKQSLIALAITPILLSGCSSLPGETPFEQVNQSVVKSTADERVLIIEKKSPDNHQGHVIYADNNLHKYFIPNNVNSRDELPDVQVKTSMHLIDYDLSGIMTMLTDSVDMSFIIDREVVEQSATSSFRLKGKFPDVMKQIGQAYNVVFDVNGNNIHIKKRTHYSVSLPPMNPHAKKRIVESLVNNGATEIDDKSLNTIQYVADQESNQRITGYLDMVRQTNSLVTYKLYIWDVEIGDEQSIDWGGYEKVVKRIKKDASMEFNGSSKISMTSNCQDSSAIDPELIQTFLLTQGKVKLYKNPDFMALTGTRETMSFSKYMDIVNKDGIARTSLAFMPNYSGGLVKTQLKINMGAFSSDNKRNETGKGLSDHLSFSSYPGGASLVTGIEAPNTNEGKRSEIAIYAMPTVILLDKPTKGFIERQNYQAEHACRKEMARNESSSALKELLIKKK